MSLDAKLELLPCIVKENDIAAAITRIDNFQLLVVIVPGEDLKSEVVFVTIPRGSLPIQGPAEALAYYYTPQLHAT